MRKLKCNEVIQKFIWVFFPINDAIRNKKKSLEMLR